MRALILAGLVAAVVVALIVATSARAQPALTPNEAFAAYVKLDRQVRDLEAEGRAARQACAARLMDPAASKLCETPCRTGCPARLTPAEQAWTRRNARIETARREMKALEDLARKSPAWPEAQSGP